MNGRDHPPMAPEVFVRLRMLGFTTAGLWAVQRAVKKYTPETWAAFLHMLEKPRTPSGISTEYIVTYWNRRGDKEQTNG